MSSLCPELLYMIKTGEGDLMRFSDVDLTSYVRIELSGKSRSEGKTSPPDRVEAIVGVICTRQRWRQTRIRRWEGKRCTGWKRMRTTVTTLEEGDRPFLCDQRDGDGD